MTEDSSLQRLIRRARELGAAEVRLVDPGSIVTASWVRLKCQFGCGCYNTTLCCPPHSPPPEETRRLLDCYRRALLIRCDPGSDVKALVAALEREAFLDGYYRAFAMGCGPCGLCEECNLRSCVHPQQARPAMEACGVDVFATARANGFPLEVARDRSCRQNYYGTVLID